MAGAENRQQDLYVGLDLVPLLPGRRVPGLPGLPCLLLHPIRCPEPLPGRVSPPGDREDPLRPHNEQGDAEPAGGESRPEGNPGRGSRVPRPGWLQSPAPASLVAPRGWTAFKGNHGDSSALAELLKKCVSQVVPVTHFYFPFTSSKRGIQPALGAVLCRWLMTPAGFGFTSWF